MVEVELFSQFGLLCVQVVLAVSSCNNRSVSISVVVVAVSSCFGSRSGSCCGSISGNHSDVSGNLVVAEIRQWHNDLPLCPCVVYRRRCAC